ncbi:hypothetical protein E4U43_001377 [Claviceps pusilla]|uniref:Uncharacterized protein n=1 Tax=Claviceps pusilla TaxID=123648 RepID=A0A9P7SVZ7_9HYPO|nr:hypothetical protein E4U43_001377 [Claviceps pusilla]
MEVATNQPNFRRMADALLVLAEEMARMPNILPPPNEEMPKLLPSRNEEMLEKILNEMIDLKHIMEGIGNRLADGLTATAGSTKAC